MVKVVPGFVEYQMTQNRHAEQSKITNGVQDLVPDKFIRVSQAPFIEDPVLVNNHRIIEGAAFGQPEKLHIFNFMKESEGSGITDLFNKIGFRKNKVQGLLRNRGVLELDRAGDAALPGGVE